MSQKEVLEELEEDYRTFDPKACSPSSAAT
jgi:hypothetical protein